jgi:single-stranded-DNA-specific exonuclease
MSAGVAAAAHDLAIDAEVRLADVTRPAVIELDQLGPFGAENRRPVFAASGVELVGAPKRMGEGERHLSVMVRHFGITMRGVAFGKGEWADELTQHAGPIDISFQPKINRFRGQEKVEFQLLDWQPTRSAVPVGV